MSILHLPVLAGEVIEFLALQEGGIYIDATVGLGGHSEMILKMIGQDGRIIGIDRDENALKLTAERLGNSRLILRKGSFSELEAIARAEGIKEVDGIMLDLGVSMMQLKDLSRGFSFNSNDRLDMRMDSSQVISAWDVVNTYTEKELIRILKEYGEEHRAARVARAIVSFRAKNSINTCSELADIILRSLGRTGRTHPATKTFQALRIEVNKELDELGKALNASLKMLKKGGRLCVISYHSLEDRIVKHFMRDSAKAEKIRLLSKKPLQPGREETLKNPSSRSAKLRGAEKIC